MQIFFKRWIRPPRGTDYCDPPYVCSQSVLYDSETFNLKEVSRKKIDYTMSQFYAPIKIGLRFAPPLFCLFLLAQMLTGCGADRAPQAPVSQSAPPVPMRERAMAATVQLIVPNDNDPSNPFIGSGSIVRSDGLILTNFHVIGDRIKQTFYNTHGIVYITLVVLPNGTLGKRYMAVPELWDTQVDLAILRISAESDGAPIRETLKLPVIELGDSDVPRSGDTIFIHGFPGVGGIDSLTTTRGIVAGFEVARVQGTEQRIWIKTDAQISRGNSGGIATDENGRLIGVPTAVTFDPTLPTALGYVRPINLALPLLQRIDTTARHLPTSITPNSSAITPVARNTPASSPQVTPTVDNRSQAKRLENEKIRYAPGDNRFQSVAVDVFNLAKGSRHRLFELQYSILPDVDIPSAVWGANGETVLVTSGEWNLADYGTSPTFWVVIHVVSRLQTIRSDGNIGLAIAEREFDSKIVSDSYGYGSGHPPFAISDAIPSPDGQRIAMSYTAQNGERCPFVMNSNGSGLRKLPSCEADDHPRYWSTDGKWIVVWSERGLRLYAHEVDGNRRLPLEQLGKISVYDQRYWPWRVTDSPACKDASFWECE